MRGDLLEFADKKIDCLLFGDIELAEHVVNTGGQDFGHGGLDEKYPLVAVFEGPDVLVGTAGL